MADTKSLGDQGLQKYTQYIRTLANATYQPIGDYATTADLSDYATTTWINNQHYATTAQIPTVPTNVSAFTNDANYATTAQIPDVSGYATTAQLLKNLRDGTPSHSLEGASSTAGGSYAMAIGQNTTANGAASFAQGYSTYVSGSNGHAEGQQTRVTGNNGAHAEGNATTASGYTSHAEGQGTSASGNYSHAEGYATTANGNQSHAEGYQTITNNSNSHAQGYGTRAEGNCSHVEGSGSTASGDWSHAEGNQSLASGMYSHAGGWFTVAQGQGQTVIGQYNVAQGSTTSHTAGDHAFIIGNGTANNARSNAMSVTWNGVIDAAALDTTGDIEANGYVNATGGLFYDGTDILQLIYPIGAIYMSTNNTLPAALVSFGTWTQIKDVFLLAAGDTYTAGDTGGQATITYTPAGSNGATALSIAQMPSHYHFLARDANSQGASTASGLDSTNYISVYATKAKSDLPYSLRHHNSTPNVGRSSSQGSGNTHNHTWTGTQATLNNMPPYKVVYAWERTA